VPEAMFVAVISKDRILPRLAPSHLFAAYGGFAAREPTCSRLRLECFRLTVPAVSILPAESCPDPRSRMFYDVSVCWVFAAQLQYREFSSSSVVSRPWIQIHVLVTGTRFRATVIRWAPLISKCWLIEG
jgi:hypothetical protein